MSKKSSKKVTSIIAAAVLSLALAVPAFALLLENNQLYYDGGQNSSIVWSEIGRCVGVTTNWMCKATVTVGGNTYTSGYQSNYARIEANRSFWANETSLYSYYQY